MPDRTPEPVTASLDSLRRINAACERYEAERREGGCPTIETYLDELDPRDRPSALAELIGLDLELRREGGERPEPGDYLRRFPDHALEITAAFAFNPDRATIPPDGETVEIGPGGVNGPSAPTLRPSTVFGDYELIEEIARGGMGVVYRARQRILNRVVALKMILAGRFASPAEIRRFLREAETAASFDHPNIVPIYDVGEHEGLVFFSMKLVEGESLSLHAPRLAGDYRAVATLLATVARAVHHAHRRGYLHRDLKPANILMDADGHPHVADFGLARRFASSGGLTDSGTIVGTPSYMAPEQAAGGREGLTEMVDVYSLGAVLYEMLTGRPPFRADSVMETIVQVLEREPPPPRQVRAGIPTGLESICLRCLGKSPADRYPTALALAEDLERYARGESVAARHARGWQRLRRWSRREPELAARLGGLAILGLLVQLNDALGPIADRPAHRIITAIMAGWAIAAVGYQAALRAERHPYAIRLAWLATEVVLITAILRVRDNPTSAGVVVYPLLIAASGLWSRVRLVWWTTGLAEVAYAALLLDAAARGKLASGSNGVSIVLGALAVTGFVVVQHVKRIWAISSFYEQRPAPE